MYVDALGRFDNEIAVPCLICDLYGEPAFFRQKNVEEYEWKDVPKDVIMNGDRIGKRTSSDRTKSDD